MKPGSLLLIKYFPHYTWNSWSLDGVGEKALRENGTGGYTVTTLKAFRNADYANQLCEAIWATPSWSEPDHIYVYMLNLKLYTDMYLPYVQEINELCK